ncbi:MAG: IS630 family transposase [Magnetococcales bacterium]|nr:IS630 family transposase [Magnetococcales bacterium]
MRTVDGRKLDHKTLERKRIQAVQSVLEGASPANVMEDLGLTKPRIYEWMAKYEKGGCDALKAKSPGRPRKLTDAQLSWLYRTVVGTNPLDLHLPFALWTRGMVRDLIGRELGIDLNEVTVGRLLESLGLMPKKSVGRDWQSDPALMEKWSTKILPEMKALAKSEKAILCFGSSSFAWSKFHLERDTATEQAQDVKSSIKPFRINVLSVVNGRGSLRFMPFEGRLSAVVFITFFKRLLYNAERSIHLVMDNHAIYHSTQVRDFVEFSQANFVLCFHKSSSPEIFYAKEIWGSSENHGIGAPRRSGRH